MRSGGPSLPSGQAGLRNASLSVERDRLLLHEITRRGLGEEQVAAMRFPHVTVLVLRMADDIALATGSAADAVVIERIVRACQGAAERHRIRYLKILNEQIVAAEGFDAEDKEGAAERLANAALEIDAECTRIFTSWAGRRGSRWGSTPAPCWDRRSASDRSPSTSGAKRCGWRRPWRTRRPAA